MSSSSSYPISFSTSSVYPTSFFVSVDWIFTSCHLTLNNSTSLQSFRFAVCSHTVLRHPFRAIHLPTSMLHLLYLSSYAVITDASTSDVSGSFNPPFKLMSLCIGAHLTYTRASVLFLHKIFPVHITQIFFSGASVFFDAQPWLSRAGLVLIMVFRECMPSLLCLDLCGTGID